MRRDGRRFFGRFSGIVRRLHRGVEVGERLFEIVAVPVKAPLTIGWVLMVFLRVNAARIGLPEGAVWPILAADPVFLGAMAYLLGQSRRFALAARTAPVQALALQTTCHAINRCEGLAQARAQMMDNIARVHRQVLASKGFIGPDLKLVVAPEYFLTSYPLGDTLPGWAAKAALAPDGPEYTRLGDMCRDAGIYFSGNAYETDAHFPGLYFQTSFILDDSGRLILRYRRLVSMYGPTPHDLWDRYLQIYGLDGVFPVVDTPLGRLACVASEEILYPEIARSLALRGAEVLLHSSSEVASPRLTPKDVAKRARAYENCAWVVSANSGGIRGVDIPESSADGLSKVVDYLDAMGQVWAAADLSVSRAGAGSVAEAWANATPTVFLPNPYHHDQHQRHNAQPMADGGGAVMISDEIDPERNADLLVPVLLELLGDRRRREGMRTAARRTCPPDGAAAVAAWIDEALG